MSEEIEKLNELSDFFRKMNAKIILLRFLKKAKSEYDKFNFEECRKSLIKAYFADKKNPVVYRGLGCINQFRGKFNSAVRYFNTGLKYSDKKVRDKILEQSVVEETAAEMARKDFLDNL